MSPASRVRRCQEILAHAWMVRTFVKHCDEVEEFPELMQLPRTVFDLCRAVEPLVDRPEEYLRILRKKLSRLRKAVAQFTKDAPIASAHTNFQQAVISIQACHAELASAAGSSAQPSAADEDAAELTDDLRAVESQHESPSADE